MFNIIANTLDGVIQTTVNAVKAPIGIAVSPLDNGKTFTDSMDGVIEGLSRIGTESREPEK